MKQAYADWIDEIRSNGRSGRGLCSVMSKTMAEEFPELKVVRGFASGQEHVWCVTPEGEIVDPTVDQFPTTPVYEPFQPGDRVKVGRCMYCGEPIYAAVENLDDPKYARSFCDEECRCFYGKSFV